MVVVAASRAEGGFVFYGFPKSDMEAGMLPQNCFENDALLRKIQTKESTFWKYLFCV